MPAKIDSRNRVVMQLTNPRDYQSTNAAKLACSPFGILLMDMGTGKTLTVLLSLYSKYKENKDLTTIITMPNMLQTNFLIEIEKHFGKFFRINNITGKKHQIRQGCLNLIPFSIINHYTSCEPDILVVDEAHAARNPKTKTHSYIKSLAQSSQHAWLLTGTPIVNKSSDLSTLMSLRPDDECVVLTTIKSEVLDLPEVEYIKHKVALHKPFRYKSSWTIAQINEDRVYSSLNKQKWKIIKETTGDKLVFVTYKEAVKGLMEYLGTDNTINGDMSMPERYKHIDRFQKHGGTIICTYDAAGVGINLTRANHVFCVDPAWNPAKINQAIDRVHRYGLEHPVKVHLLQQPNELWIYGIIGRKQNIIKEQLQVAERLPVAESIGEKRIEVAKPQQVKIPPVKIKIKIKITRPTAKLMS